MPQVFKVGSYWVYFWANENEPLEPIHVHVAQGAPNSNATKIWITESGCFRRRYCQRQFVPVCWQAPPARSTLSARSRNG